MRNPFRKKMSIGCKWSDFCTKCHDLKKPDYCTLCEQYRFIDSGYGWCNLLPESIVVAWCKDPCSYYNKVREKG